MPEPDRLPLWLGLLTAAVVVFVFAVAPGNFEPAGFR